MDFYEIKKKESDRKKGRFDVYPDFKIEQSKDLMVRGGQFYAIWDEERGMWSTDPYDVPRLVDKELRQWEIENGPKIGGEVKVKYLTFTSNRTHKEFLNFCKDIADHSRQLDQTLTFKNSEVKRSDYSSKRLPYSLAPGDCSAWDELVGTLYSVDERAKIEWAIGAVVSGDSRKIQKFLVFYGGPATGKSTVLNIIHRLFEGYTTTFDARALVSSNNAFAMERFSTDPLVALQHDGDLSRISDNSILNSIVSHEEMTMNEKFKKQYSVRVNAFLFMGTNQPVHISDAKSGIIRRLIDVNPTGVHIPNNHYEALMSRIEMSELGAIADRCLGVYRSMGKNYYNSYRAKEMMLQTDFFFNYIEAYYDIFKAQDGTTLKQAYGLYKEFCEESGIEKKMARHKFREELRNYFNEFKDRGELNEVRVSSLYLGFNAEKFKTPVEDADAYSLVMDETVSLFDEEFANQPAQYSKLQKETEREIPRKEWARVTTVLSDLDTATLHFVRVPENLIVIDFDLKSLNGHSALERNLEAASNWPPTYAEISKSGDGVHLHYLYDGDVSTLSAGYSDGIEVKTLLGDASLRRKLTYCNNIPFATISSGLPIKEKKVLPSETIKSERGLRDLIARNLRKEIHPGTKPSVDFIKHILDEAYDSGMSYDVSDLRSRVMAFANNSTNQPLQCLKLVQKMRFQGTETVTDAETPRPEMVEGHLTFFDVEVFPNLLGICYSYEGSDEVVKMVNPSPQDVEKLFSLKLVGFNCRRYDNHILYARFMGYDNEQLYKLSQKLIGGDRNAPFGEAYSLSYADVWDFSSEKKTLKWFQIQLGLPHMELGLPWDQPIPDELIESVMEYCSNDVTSLKELFKARKQDFVARQILADLSGLTVNDTTQKHTARIIFNGDRNPQASFVYTDLSKEFPGYEFDMGKSHYRGELVGEGGYVYAEPGMYENVAVLDVVSMHPTTIEILNVFGDYTPRFSDLKAARVAIKAGDYESARMMLNGKLAPYLENKSDATELAWALKIVINIVYGLTSAKFDNPFRDTRNRDNIVAKRGALFMIDLKQACQQKGLDVVHIKTDSIKIPNATPEDIWEIQAFGEKYGYNFVHEATYDKFCLVNDAVYIAKEFVPGNHSYTDDEWHWTAIGAQFQHPYVYKTLFSGAEIDYEDLCEQKQVVKGAMYLDFEIDNPPGPIERMQFIGRSALVMPVKRGPGAGILWRVADNKLYAVTGTKNWLWAEADMVGMEEAIDMSYFEELAEKAIKTIEKFGSFEELVR